MVDHQRQRKVLRRVVLDEVPSSSIIEQHRVSGPIDHRPAHVSGGISIAEGLVDALKWLVAVPGTDGYGHHRVSSSEPAPSVDVQIYMFLNVVAVAAVHRHEVKDDDVSSQT